MIQDLIEKGALFVVNHSGGKDSQAMMIRLVDLVPVRQLLVVHAALGEVEWEGALELAERQAAAAGAPFIVARSVKTFFEMVEHRFKVRPGPNSPCWPSAENRQCTSDLKRGPIQREVRRYAKERGFTLIVSCMGIRAQESPARAKHKTLKLNERCSVAGRLWYEWLPIHQLTTEEVSRRSAVLARIRIGHTPLATTGSAASSASWAADAISRTARATARICSPSTPRSSSALATPCT